MSSKEDKMYLIVVWPNGGLSVTKDKVKVADIVQNGYESVNGHKLKAQVFLLPDMEEVKSCSVQLDTKSECCG